MDSQLNGDTELIAKLIEIDERVAGKWLRTALRDGAKVVQQQCIAWAPVKSGVTRNAIKVRAGKRRQLGIYMLVTLSKRFFPVKENTFYVGFVDRGRKTGTGRGWKALSYRNIRREIPGTLWLELAFERSIGRAREVIYDTLARGLAKEAKK
jgi:hypothetical protein